MLVIHTNPHSRFVRPPCKELARQNGELLPAARNHSSTPVTGLSSRRPPSQELAQFETWAPVMGDEQTDARLQRISPTVFLCQRLQSCADFENLVSSEGMINV